MAPILGAGGLDIVSALISAPLGLLELAPPNVRWMNSIRDAAPRIANQIRDPGIDFMFVPGVNSEGLSVAEKQALRAALYVEGKKTVFCHSAGTHACTEALQYLSPQELENINFVFASPRVEFGQFDAAIRAAGLRQNQVAVITSAFDLPHWTDLDSVNFNPINNIPLDYAVGSIRDYVENPNASYRYVFLKDSDASAENYIASLEHGSMFNGILNGWLYNIKLDGTSIQPEGVRRSIESVLLDIFRSDEE